VSINPVSDIVLDVARAADPARSAAATARLARVQETDVASIGDFSRLVEAKRVEPNLVEPGSARVATTSIGTKRAADGRAEAVEGLERLLLQRLVEAMLPKETAAVFGHGTSGDVWRSMLAEQLAVQIASVVDLGIGRNAPYLAPSEPATVDVDRRDTAHSSAADPTDRGA